MIRRSGNRFAVKDVVEMTEAWEAQGNGLSEAMWLVAYGIAGFSYIMTNLTILRMLQVAIMTDGFWSFFNGSKTLAKPDQRWRFIWVAVFMGLTFLMAVAGSELQRM